MDESEHWKPDDALILTVRTRCVPISGLSGPDRSWLVAALTVQGWTVAAIADRLRCSLRLIQTIKTEPMTRVALYALELRKELANERDSRDAEQRLAACQADAQGARVARLVRQRDTLLRELQRRHSGRA